MVTLGLDPHPGTHTVVALDLNGSLLASLTVLNTAPGIAQLRLFASQFSLRRWAIEGAGNHFIAAFVKQLLENGEAVHSICPNLTSQYRSRRGRRRTTSSTLSMLPVLCWRIRSCRFCRAWIPNVSYRSCPERNAGYRNSSNRIVGR